MNSSVFDRIKVLEHAGIEYLPRSTPASLDDFESQVGVLLPATYREFCERFGAGELAGLYRIAAPIEVSDRHNLTQYNSRKREGVANGDYDLYGPREITQQFIFFCDGGGEAYAWKPDESNDLMANEYVIYCLRRSNKLQRIALTFAGFVESVISRRGAEADFARFQLRK